jgi:hypothetical protein
LAGKKNTRADVASRHRGDRSEWKLNPSVFQLIDARFGAHLVDLMASRTNSQLPVYFSQWGDPSAAGKDVFKQDWCL